MSNNKNKEKEVEKLSISSLQQNITIQKTQTLSQPSKQIFIQKEKIEKDFWDSVISKIVIIYIKTKHKRLVKC